ncbi:MAG: hypothetical protein WDZ77_01810 [Candidatus Pacearchaeota archaeon]
MTGDGSRGEFKFLNDEEGLELPEFVGAPGYEERMKEAHERNESIIAKSQSYESMVIPFSGKVKMIEGHNIPYSDGRSFQIPGNSGARGWTHQCRELVILLDEEKPLLIFSGNANVRVGDEIKAYVFCGRQEFLESEGLSRLGLDSGRLPSVFIPREFGEVERILYLETFGGNKMVSRDFSNDCPRNIVDSIREIKY